MFKKLLVASAILAASSSVAIASPYKGENYKGEVAAPCQTCQFCAGPYVGLSIGSRTNWEERHFNRRHDFLPLTGVGFGGGINNRLGYNFFKGFSGILSVGYAMMVNPMFYAGGEFFVGDSARLTNKNHRNQNVRSTWDYGFDVIPGVMLTDCVMAYVRGGVIRTQFKSHNHNGRTGWRVGLGGQATIVQNWDGRIEYIYNQFGNKRHIRAEQFNIGVVYKFL